MRVVELVQVVQGAVNLEFALREPHRRPPRSSALNSNDRRHNVQLQSTNDHREDSTHLDCWGKVSVAEDTKALPKGLWAHHAC